MISLETKAQQDMQVNQENSNIILSHEEYGAGQALVALVGSAGVIQSSFIDVISAHPLPSNKTIVMRVGDFGDNSDAAALAVLQHLDLLGIRTANFIGIGSVGTAAIALALREIKKVRRLVLIDTPVRPQSSLRDDIFSWIENKLPLGLPFRKEARGFDARSYLQRVRCPTIIITTPDADDDLKKQAQEESRALATAWFKEISSAQEFRSVLEEFMLVPAKRPQKNREVGMQVSTPLS